MKFYGNGVVWDSKNNKRLFKFVNGEYETEDERIISIMTGKPIKKPVNKTASFADLRKQAKEAKIKGYIKMKKVELIEALKEVSE